MKQSLGLVEIIGMSTAVLVADVMVKAANVRIIEMENSKGLGYMTIKIQGDVGAVKAAVDAGSQMGRICGKLAGCKVIPRPSDYVEQTFCSPKDPAPSALPVPEQEVIELPSDREAGIPGEPEILGTPEISGTSETPEVSEISEAPEILETSGASEISEAPEISKTPEILETPEVSEITETPEILETPGASEISEAPEILETPQVSEITETPEILETPGVSEISETPEISEAPKTPETPELLNAIPAEEIGEAEGLTEESEKTVNKVKKPASGTAKKTTRKTSHEKGDH
ncbi:BMC domain-containing protein [Lacrimispora sp.]|uniref:BMC domain-containing protein n=1 Tax=Lacrimispora sp. TaxID=2719234 RepID=UPI002FDB0EA1